MFCSYEALVENAAQDCFAFLIGFANNTDFDEEKKMWQHTVTVRRYEDKIVAFLWKASTKPLTCGLIASFLLVDVASVSSVAEGSTEKFAESNEARATQSEKLDLSSDVCLAFEKDVVTMA